MTDSEVESRLRALQAMVIVSVRGNGAAQIGAFKSGLGILEQSAINTGDAVEWSTYSDMIAICDGLLGTSGDGRRRPRRRRRLT